MSTTYDFNLPSELINTDSTGAVDTSTKSQSSGYGGYASAISTISSLVQGELETQQFKAQLEAKTDAAIQNVGNAVTSFELQQYQNKQNIDNINHILGDKLSERGLNAIKEASMLKAASAMTGTSGGSTNEAIKEAFINENMDKANIVASAKQRERSILMSMDMNKMSINNQIDSTLLGGVAFENNSLLSGIYGGLSTATNALSLMPVSERASAFGINTKGAK